MRITATRIMIDHRWLGQLDALRGIGGGVLVPSSVRMCLRESECVIRIATFSCVLTIIAKKTRLRIQFRINTEQKLRRQKQQLSVCQHCMPDNNHRNRKANQLRIRKEQHRI